MQTQSFNCPNLECGAPFRAEIVVHVGGVNDYGWWILECGTCDTIFSEYVGRDVNDSHLVSGGKVLKKMDRDVFTEPDVAEEVARLKAACGT